MPAIFTELGTSPAVAEAVGSDDRVRRSWRSRRTRCPQDGSYFTFIKNFASLITDNLRSGGRTGGAGIRPTADRSHVELLGPLLDPFLDNEFMLRALLAGILVSLACAVVGTFVVLRGLAFIGDALAHGVLPGVAVAVLLGLPGMLGRRGRAPP